MEIKSAKYINNYKIKFVFIDGSTKTVDFWPFMKDHKSPHVIPYKNITKFKKFEVKNGSKIVWGKNYDICFGAETIYSGVITSPDNKKIKETIIQYFGNKKAEKMFAEMV